ncbi:MAG TPA: flagellar biosynthetic protein FliO [Phycisphaerae bacterium]|nr:flagellar biosynthetic protein FliO [Phycisphaerae bacterium]
MAFRKAQWTAVLAAAVLSLVSVRNAYCDTRPAEDAPVASTSEPTRPADIEDKPVGGAGVEDQTFRPEDKGPDWRWVQPAVALAIVVGLLFGLRWLLRRLGARGQAAADSDVIQVLARMSLSPKERLLLVRLGGRLVLVGSGTAGLTALCEITDPLEVSELTERAAAAGGTGLKDLFRGKSRRRGEAPPDAGAAAHRDSSDGESGA